MVVARGSVVGRMLTPRTDLVRWTEAGSHLEIPFIPLPRATPPHSSLSILHPRGIPGVLETSEQGLDPFVYSGFDEKTVPRLVVTRVLIQIDTVPLYRHQTSSSLG
jgi:hypothetical protein